MAIIKNDFRDSEDVFKAVHNALVNNGWTVVSSSETSYENALQPAINLDSQYTGKFCVYKGVGYNENRPPYIYIRYLWSKLNNVKTMYIRFGTGYVETTKELVNGSPRWEVLAFDALPGSYHICVDNGAFFMVLSQNNIYQNLYMGLILPLMTPFQYQLPMTVKTTMYNGLTSADTYIPNAENIKIGGYAGDILGGGSKINGAGEESPIIYSPANTYIGYLQESFINSSTKNVTIGYITMLNNFRRIIKGAKIDKVVFAKNQMLYVGNAEPFTIIGSYKFVIMLYGNFNIGSTVTINGKKYRVYLSLYRDTFYGVEDE